MIKRKIILIFIINIFATFLISGCWNKVELEEKAIVAGVGIDKGDSSKGVLLTLQAVLPSAIQSASSDSRSQSGTPVEIVTVRGLAIFDALRNYSLLSGRKGLYSHARVIVLGEEAAKSGINQYLDVFFRDPEMRRRTFLLIAKGEAKDIMEADVRFENIPAYGISDILQVYKVASKIVPVDLKRFIELFESKYTSPFVGGIEIIKNKDQNGNMRKGFKVTDTAIFKEDKLIGWLDEFETRGLLWILGEVGSGIIHVNYPTSERFIELEILKSNTTVEPELKNGKLTFTIDVTEEGNITDMYSSVNLLDQTIIKAIEEKGAKVIENEIMSVVKKAQKYNADIFGFNEEVYRKYPKEWKTLKENWASIFPALEVKVKATAKIRRAGNIYRRR